ncbi:MAG: NAD synthetase [Zetaproteobacteria bacterium CG12_big_fil_rev_8_21_14_0_65_55_1124]|nr:MAG: NAD synthetase [Zetaproteobacteria bacterium CG1_02_55_237]PIS19924.1 MAG: NAD synthetase [Zetaproteobacteria bacterium CG08_land_8_20_14_0_20_55_17]PIW43653.1 MAG: NAD synthetase [Zetaproteobacteria bacterium CG12_big_fil_rev_8_21_14_0_65_55_1124]PIY52678.1 MAG: NAD synthetase [Zetaproteobacteria bacterium CG_4_10_14_0_8_um_filter_55_43]PIZ37862.1 MAG: NAD synthetase [Zetaproteobacteria bacterium CG_4_10_14_0_2_um_filter_55_20]PJB80467.1 MAG: NAD synthetase [Zetaproteobacteria bacteri
MSANMVAMAYLAAAVLFILALKGLSSPVSARRGNLFGMLGMALAVGVTLSIAGTHSYLWIFIAVLIGGGTGTLIARSIPMTHMPQLVAAMHSLVGLAAVMIAASALYNPQAYGIAAADGSLHIASRIELFLGTFIGAITFTASVVAFAKLQGLVSGRPLVFPGQHLVNLLLGIIMIGSGVVFCMTGEWTPFLIMTGIALVLGVLLIVPIGGADMPVVVSMLNSYSGWAAAGIGFTLSNNMLIVSGALVGSSGAILSYIMCRAMNRSLFNVLMGGFGAVAGSSSGGAREERPYHTGAAEDAAFMLQNAESVIIIPGYGLAVARAQHALKEVADVLTAAGVKVRFAIHPVAGRMPGHMNVLLAEADVPYDAVQEMDEINPEFAETDVALVIGANDVTNPSAKTDPTSSIYGMPILDVDKARHVIFIKRSMAAGYAGLDNDLFYMDKTMMLFSDAKKACEDMLHALK